MKPSFRVRDDLKRIALLVLVIVVGFLLCMALAVIASPYPQQPVQQVGTVLLPGHLIGAH